MYRNFNIFFLLSIRIPPELFYLVLKLSNFLIFFFIFNYQSFYHLLHIHLLKMKLANYLKIQRFKLLSYKKFYIFLYLIRSYLRLNGCGMHISRLGLQVCIVVYQNRLNWNAYILLIWWRFRMQYRLIWRRLRIWHIYSGRQMAIRLWSVIQCTVFYCFLAISG